MKQTDNIMRLAGRFFASKPRPRQKPDAPLPVPAAICKPSSYLGITDHLQPANQTLRGVVEYVLRHPGEGEDCLGRLLSEFLQLADGLLNPVRIYWHMRLVFLSLDVGETGTVDPKRRFQAELRVEAGIGKRVSASIGAAGLEPGFL